MRRRFVNFTLRLLSPWPSGDHPERQISSGGVWRPGRAVLGVQSAGRRAHTPKSDARDACSAI